MVLATPCSPERSLSQLLFPSVTLREQSTGKPHLDLDTRIRTPWRDLLGYKVWAIASPH